MTNDPEKPRGFVLYSMPRTGSNMMVSLLNSHEEIACAAAIFSAKGWPKNIGRFRGRTRPPKSIAQRLAALPEEWDDVEWRNARVAALLERLLDVFSDKEACGFKQHLANPGDQTLREVIDQRWAALILNRANRLASYSSNKLVAITGEGALRGDTKPTRAKTEFVAEEFDQFRARRDFLYDHWTKEIERSGVPQLTVDYCEARTSEGDRRIGRFLGLASSRFGQPDTVKRNPDDILSRFTNPLEAEKHLRANGLLDWAQEA